MTEEDTAELFPIVDDRLVDGYFINRRGEVFSTLRSSTPRQMKTHVSSTTGYVHISLRLKLGGDAMFIVHNMVARTFIPLPESDAILEACHKDGVRSNPVCSNLYWGTKVQNMADRLAHRLARDEDHPRAKLTREEVIALRTALHNGETPASAAVRLNLSPSYVVDVYKGKFWSHVPLGYEPRDFQETQSRIPTSRLLDDELVKRVYTLHFVDKKTYTEIAVLLNGKPHKVTVRRICLNDIPAYHHLFKEFQCP
jgi:hypothetical protein